jgi:hypothetical protein
MQSRVASVAVTIGILVLLNGLSYVFNWGWVFY